MTTRLDQFLWLAKADGRVWPGHFEIGATDQFQVSANIPAHPICRCLNSRLTASHSVAHDHVFAPLQPNPRRVPGHQHPALYLQARLSQPAGGVQHFDPVRGGRRAQQVRARFNESV